MPARSLRLPKAVLAGLASMRPAANADHPDVTPQQRGAAEVAKLIRKLRWIGMEDDAKRLEIAFSGIATPATVH